MLNNRLKPGGRIILVPSEDVFPSENSSRIIISSEELYNLSLSIEKNGLLNPISVYSIGNGKYRVVSGERRRRAAIDAGLTYLPCLLLKGSCEEVKIINLVENMHCKELHFLEIAEAIERMRDTMNLSQISDALCIPEGLILSRVKLLSLPGDIKLKIITSGLSEENAVSLCKISDYQRQKRILEMMSSLDISFSEAYEATEEQKKSVFSAHFKDYTVFQNTIEHAVAMMNASGIVAGSEKHVTENEIIYTVKINKVV